MHDGFWALKVLEEGNYEISVLRWPVESGKAINASLPEGSNVPGASKAFRAQPGVGINATKATLRIDGKELGTQDVRGDAKSISFTTRLTKGKHELSPYFHVPQGQLGCYYAVVKKL